MSQAISNNGLCSHGKHITEDCQPCEDALYGPFNPKPKHEHSWECLDASGKCMMTGEV